MREMRVYAEIDLNAISRNAKNVRKIVGDKTKIMAVVKADGYGHGAVPVSKRINDIADAYAVATIEEAVELRQSGIDKEILILGYIMYDYFDTAIAYDISLTVFTYEMASKMSDYAKLHDKTVKVHIAVDTGMGRIGFYPCDESVAKIKQISELPGIEIEGLFTHFATADEADKTYSHSQMKKYCDFARMLEESGIHIKTKHISNSAAITEFEDCRFDMVRMGIILYGLYPSEEVDKTKINLTPAMSIKSSIVYLKTINEGESVSYGRKYTAAKPTRVATVPIGYADGYPRLLSNKGRVLICGKYAPVIGNVCMDQMMVDVSDIPEAKIGDDVVLVGSQGENAVTFEEVANLSGTINYEVICGIGKRVPRVYKY